MHNCSFPLLLLLVLPVTLLFPPLCISTVDDHGRQDEEHKLIARYTSRLADTEGSGVGE